MVGGVCACRCGRLGHWRVGHGGLGNLCLVGHQHGRKVQRKACALAWGAVHVNGTAVGAHHAMHYRQAQARALAHRLGGEKRLKNARQRGTVHAGAAVAHLQGHVGPRRQAQALAQVGCGLDQQRLHQHGAAFVTNRVDGVGTQIQQRLLNLCHVGQHGRQVLGGAHLQVDGGRQCDAQQALGVVHHLGPVHGAALQRLVAAEGEDLPHQIARAAPGFFNFAQALQNGRLRILGQGIGLGQLDVAQNGAQDVVEVVCNAARHGANGLHLVRFAQLRFQLVAPLLGFFAPGQVARKHGDGLALAVALKADAHLHRQGAPAGGARRHLAQHGLGGEVLELQRLRHIGQKTLERAAQRVVRGALEQRGCGGVEHRDAVVLIDANDGIQRRVDDGLQAPLAGVQLLVALLQRLALGNQGALVNHRAQVLAQRQ